VTSTSTDAERPTALLWGRFSAFGLVVLALVALLDQASKFWLLYGFDLRSRGVVTVTPFLDLVLQWNTGISYGLFPQHGTFGKWALLILTAVAVVLLWMWLARAPSRLSALALGLIIGGAVGNAADRLHWPGVMDFVLAHVTIGEKRYDWYVFNLADAAIVLGVVALLCETLVRDSAAKAPRS
jgi:signal peptidase II